MSDRKQILVLDIDESALIETEALLEEAGFDATTSWDLQEAVDLLYSRRFDLVLVRDHPPEMSATDVFKWVHQTQAGVGCVVLHSAAPGESRRYPGAAAVADKRQINEILRIVEKCFSNQADTSAA